MRKFDEWLPWIAVSLVVVLAVELVWIELEAVTHRRALYDHCMADGLKDYECYAMTRVWVVLGE